MSARVELPKGCYGLECADGTKYTADPGGHIEVSDRHAAAIKTSQHGQIGMLSASKAYHLGTKRGRRCPRCHFLGQAWSVECPRCGTLTQVDQAPAAKPVE
jgi:hypothetical protein